MSQIEMVKNGKMSQIKRTLEAIFIKSISDVPQTEAPAAVNRDARVASRPRRISIYFLFICPRSAESRFKRISGKKLFLSGWLSRKMRMLPPNETEWDRAS
jgi:hypothetical protein